MRFSHRGALSVRRWITIALGVGLVMVACGGSGGYVPAGIVRSPAPDVSGVSLLDVASGNDFAFQAEPGGLLVVFWGYTSCPDVCPTTLADLRRAMRDMGESAEVIDVAMVTIDPNRDTPEVLAAFVQVFFPDGRAIRTEDAAALAAAAVPFGASYEVTANPDGLVDVAHTGFLYAIDENGLIRLTWPFGTNSDDIRLDLESLLKEGNNA